MNHETPIDLTTAQPYPGLDDFGSTDSQPRSRRKWWIIAAVVLAGALIAWLVMGRSGGADTAAGARAGQAPTVTVVAPGRGTIEGTITATGTLGARGASCRSVRSARVGRSFACWSTRVTGSARARSSR